MRQATTVVAQARLTEKNFLKLQDAHAEQAQCIKALQEDSHRTEKFKKTIASQEEVISMSCVNVLQRDDGLRLLCRPTRRTTGLIDGANQDAGKRREQSGKGQISFH